MKKLLLAAFMLSVCFCLIPVAAEDACMDTQSLEFVAIPDRVTPGSDFIHRLTIHGSGGYHYSCDLEFDPFSIETGISAPECGPCDVFSRGNNQFRLDSMPPGSYDFHGRVRPDYIPSQGIMPSMVWCTAFPEPDLFEFGCREVTLNPAVAHFSVEEIPHPAPEFPSMGLPAMLVLGFLGAVLLIRRTREY